MVTAIISTGTTINQPSAEKLIIRSDSASDTTQTLTIYSGGTSTPFTLAGRKEILTGDISSINALTLSAECEGTVSIFKEGTAGTGRIYSDCATQPTNTQTLTITYGGLTETYTFKDTASTTWEVQIGADVAATRTNLAAKITAVSVLLDAVVSGSAINLTDKFKSGRTGAWSAGGTAPFIFSAITGGIDGALVTSFSPGALKITAAVDLNNDSLSEDNLPVGQFVSDWYAVGGRAFSVYLAKLAHSMTISYEVSTDRNNPIVGVPKTAITTPHITQTRMILSPSEEAVEFFRLLVTNNESVAKPFSAKIVTGR